MRKQKQAAITASINSWALACGTDYNQFARMLKRAGIEFTPGQDLSASDAFRAVTFRTEKDQAIARQANARAEQLEMENKVQRKELLDLAQVEKIVWTDCLSPLRTEILNLASQVAPLCQDQDTAHKALSQWADSTLAKIQAGKPTEVKP